MSFNNPDQKKFAPQPPRSQPPKILPPKDYNPEIKLDTGKFDELYTNVLQLEYDDIIKLIKDNSLINYKKDDGKTLAFAILENSNTTLSELQKLTILQKLVEKNVSINAHNNYNQTIVHVAAMNSYFDILQYLKELKCDFTEIDNAGNTPVHYLVDNMIKNREDSKLFSKHSITSVPTKELNTFKLTLQKEILEIFDKKNDIKNKIKNIINQIYEINKSYFDNAISEINNNVTKIVSSSSNNQTIDNGIINEITKLQTNFNTKYDEFINFDKITNDDIISSEKTKIIKKTNDLEKELKSSIQNISTIFNDDIIKKIILPVLDVNAIANDYEDQSKELGFSDAHMTIDAILAGYFMSDKYNTLFTNIITEYTSSPDINNNELVNKLKNNIINPIQEIDKNNIDFFIDMYPEINKIFLNITTKIDNDPNIDTYNKKIFAIFIYLSNNLDIVDFIQKNKNIKIDNNLDLKDLFKNIKLDQFDLEIQKIYKCFYMMHFINFPRTLNENINASMNILNLINDKEEKNGYDFIDDINNTKNKIIDVFNNLYAKDDPTNIYKEIVKIIIEFPYCANIFKLFLHVLNTTKYSDDKLIKKIKFAAILANVVNDPQLFALFILNSCENKNDPNKDVNNNYIIFYNIGNELNEYNNNNIDNTTFTNNIEKIKNFNDNVKNIINTYIEKSVIIDQEYKDMQKNNKINHKALFLFLLEKNYNDSTIFFGTIPFENLNITLSFTDLFTYYNNFEYKQLENQVIYAFIPNKSQLINIGYINDYLSYFNIFIKNIDQLNNISDNTTRLNKKKRIFEYIKLYVNEITELIKVGIFDKKFSSEINDIFKKLEINKIEKTNKEINEESEKLYKFRKDTLNYAINIFKRKYLVDSDKFVIGKKIKYNNYDFINSNNIKQDMIYIRDVPIRLNNLIQLDNLIYDYPFIIYTNIYETLITIIPKILDVNKFIYNNFQNSNIRNDLINYINVIQNIYESANDNKHYSFKKSIELITILNENVSKITEIRDKLYFNIKNIINILNQILEQTNLSSSISYFENYDKNPKTNFYKKPLHFTNKLPETINTFDINQKYNLETEFKDNCLYMKEPSILVKYKFIIKEDGTIEIQKTDIAPKTDENNNIDGSLELLTGVARIKREDEYKNQELLPIGLPYITFIFDKDVKTIADDYKDFDTKIEDFKNIKEYFDLFDTDSKKNIIFNITRDIFKDYIDITKNTIIQQNIKSILDTKDLYKQYLVNIKDDLKKYNVIDKKTLNDIILKIEYAQQINNPIKSTQSIISKDKYVEIQYINKLKDLYKKNVFNLRTTDRNGNTIIHRMIDQYNIEGIKQILEIEPYLYTYKNNNNKDSLEYMNDTMKQIFKKHTLDNIKREIRLSIDILNNILSKVDTNKNTYIQTDENLILYIFRMFNDCLLFYLYEYPNNWTQDDTDKLLKLLNLSEIKLSIDIDNLTISKDSTSYESLLNKYNEQLKILTNKKTEYTKRRDEKIKIGNTKKLDEKINKTGDEINKINDIIKEISNNKSNNKQNKNIILQKIKDSIVDDNIDFDKYHEFIKKNNNHYSEIIKFVNDKNNPILLCKISNIIINDKNNDNKEIAKKFLSSVIKDLYDDFNLLDKTQYDTHNILFKMIIDTIQVNISSTCAYNLLNLIKSVLNVKDFNDFNDKIYNQCKKYFDILIIKKLNLDQDNVYENTDVLLEQIMNMIKNFYTLSTTDEIKILFNYFDIIIEHFAKETYRLIIEFLDDMHNVVNLLEISKFIDSHKPKSVGNQENNNNNSNISNIDKLLQKIK